MTERGQESMRRWAAVAVAAATVAAAVVVVLAVVVIPIGGLDFALERERALRRASGWGAWAALAAALCVTPAMRLWAVLAPNRAVAAEGVLWGPAVRRALGLTAATLAGIHAIIVAGSLGPGVPLEALIVRPQPRLGVVAGVVLALLAATSFPGVVRRLRVRWWRGLHGTAYAAFVLVTAHVALAPHAPVAVLMALTLAVVGLGTLRALPRQSSTRAPSRSQAPDMAPPANGEVRGGEGGPAPPLDLGVD